MDTALFEKVRPALLVIIFNETLPSANLEDAAGGGSRINPEALAKGTLRKK